MGEFRHLRCYNLLVDISITAFELKQKCSSSLGNGYESDNGKPLSLKCGQNSAD